MKAATLLFLVLGTPGFAQGLDLAFSGPAEQTFRSESDFASYKLPIGPYQDGELRTLVAEGAQVKVAWRVRAATGTTLGVADNLRQQIEAKGFELLFECETRSCGGFDFRFQTDVLPEPDMHVDLGDYRFLSAQRLGGAVPEYLSLFVSRSADLAYVQMILVGGGAAEPPTLTAEGGAAAPVTQTAPQRPAQEFGDLVAALEAKGSAVLEDVVFASGGAALEESELSSLSQLAAFLKANPDRRIALVGHTDAEGQLEGNIALSRQRAQAVARRLIDQYGVSEGQVAAEGVGYLAPRASNLSAEGRTLNRRVEVILTSTS